MHTSWMRFWSLAQLTARLSPTTLAGLLHHAFPSAGLACLVRIARLAFQIKRCWIMMMMMITMMSSAADGLPIPFNQLVLVMQWQDCRTVLWHHLSSALLLIVNNFFYSSLRCVVPTVLGCFVTIFFLFACCSKLVISIWSYYYHLSFLFASRFLLHLGNKVIFFSRLSF